MLAGARISRAMADVNGHRRPRPSNSKRGLCGQCCAALRLEPCDMAIPQIQSPFEPVEGFHSHLHHGRCADNRRLTDKLTSANVSSLAILDASSNRKLVSTAASTKTGITRFTRRAKLYYRSGISVWSCGRRCGKSKCSRIFGQDIIGCPQNKKEKRDGR